MYPDSAVLYVTMLLSVSILTIYTIRFRYKHELKTALPCWTLHFMSLNKEQFSFTGPILASLLFAVTLKAAVDDF